MPQTLEGPINSLLVGLQAAMRRFLRRAIYTLDYLDELARKGLLGKDLQDEIELEDFGFVEIEMIDDCGELP